MTPTEIIEKLIKFTYEYRGMGQLRCRSCGAYGEESFDDDGTDCSTYEKHSENCPFRQAKEYLDGCPACWGLDTNGYRTGTKP